MLAVTLLPTLPRAALTPPPNFNVNVANTPLPVSGTVTGSVNVANTPNMHVTNTPSVKATNTPNVSVTNPITVAGSPGAQRVLVSQFGSVGATSAGVAINISTSTNYAVPVGKRLVIEHAAVSIAAGNDASNLQMAANLLIVPRSPPPSPRSAWSWE